MFAVSSEGSEGRCRASPCESKDVSSSDSGRSPSPSAASSLLQETSKRVIAQLYQEYQYREYLSARNNGHVLNSLNNYLSQHYHGQPSSLEVDNGRDGSRGAGGPLEPGPPSRSTAINYTSLKNGCGNKRSILSLTFSFGPQTADSFPFSRRSRARMVVGESLLLPFILLLTALTDAINCRTSLSVTRFPASRVLARQGLRISSRPAPSIDCLL